LVLDERDVMSIRASGVEQRHTFGPVRENDAHRTLFAEASIAKPRERWNIGNVRQARYDRLVRPTRGPGGRWTTDAWTKFERVVAFGCRFRGRTGANGGLQDAEPGLATEDAAGPFRGPAPGRLK
jgi:hypothetical protein